MKLGDLPAPPALLREIDARGYVDATPVQELVVAPELLGRDLLVSSRTGSGKTVAFGLVVGRDLLKEQEALDKPGAPRVLVVAPTRELAMQVARELTWLFASARGRVTTCVGGMDIRREQQALDSGAHIVVGTPGRVCDHLERGSLELSSIEAVVLDEADEMLDMGFREELERILDAAPKERRTLLFSATLPAGIESLARRFTRDVQRVAATSVAEAHADIEYQGHLVHPRERERAVVNILRSHAAESALVFCATRETVARLHASLVERGFTAVALSGDLSQAERTRALLAMREGRARILVATDVAARGLDLPAVGLVVQADLPHDASVLQHRSGRTGRAGKKGTAVLLTPFPQQRYAERLLKNARVQLEWTPLPTADDVRALDNERLREELGGQLSEIEEDDRAVARALLEAHDPEALVGALVARERGKWPAPEELPQTRTWRREPARTRDRPEGPRRPPPTGEDAVWFRVNVGRNNNADPRWLLPMLCRRGKVQKSEIGKIDIRPRETRFEVAKAAARRFEEAARRPDEKDPKVRIEPLRSPARR